MKKGGERWSGPNKKWTKSEENGARVYHLVLTAGGRLRRAMTPSRLSASRPSTSPPTTSTRQLSQNVEVSTRRPSRKTSAIEKARVTHGTRHLEVRSKSGDVLHESEEYVGVEGPLVSFVDHHNAVAPQVRLGEQLAEQHAVGHVLFIAMAEHKHKKTHTK